MQVLVAGAAALFDHIFPVRELPTRGRVAEILSAPSLFGHAYFGGTAFNIAVTLARLGVRCGVLHGVGEDFSGSEYERWLKEQGVSLQGIQVHRSQSSGHAFLFYDAQGETLCFSYPGAASQPLDAQAAAALLRSADMLVLAPVLNATGAKILELAAQQALRVAVCGVAAPELVPFLPGIDILIANRYEIGLLCQAAQVGGASELLKLGPTLIYETHGTQGSRLVTGRGEEHIPATPAETNADPTGAGDAYAGAVLAGLLSGLEPAFAGLVGSITASFVVEKLGCQTNLPDWRQIHTRWRQRFPQTLFRLPVSPGGLAPGAGQ